MRSSEQINKWPTLSALEMSAVELCEVDVLAFYLLGGRRGDTRYFAGAARRQWKRVARRVERAIFAEHFVPRDIVCTDFPSYCGSRID